MDVRLDVNFNGLLVLESRRERGEPIPVEVGQAIVREVTVAITA
jgi:hypothetical protein